MCGRLYRHGNTVFCCVGSDVLSLAMLRSDTGVTANVARIRGWEDVTSVYRGYDRGSSILYGKSNGWIDVGIVLERRYVEQQPHLLLKSWKGDEVLVAVRTTSLLEVCDVACGFGRAIPAVVDQHLA